MNQETVRISKFLSLVLRYNYVESVHEYRFINRPQYAIW
jgi:hypothetical protein